MHLDAVALINNPSNKNIITTNEELTITNRLFRLLPRTKTGLLKSLQPLRESYVIRALTAHYPLCKTSFAPDRL